jgi:F-type H+-transporting ATPase subunit b
MINVNATLLLQVMHFLLLTLILNRLLFRPILKLMRERVRHIEGSQKEVEDIDWKIKKLMGKCNTMERENRRSAGEERARLAMDAKRAAEEVFNDTRNQVGIIREQTVKQVEVQIQKAQSFIHREAVALADDIEAKLINRRLDH